MDRWKKIFLFVLALIAFAIWYAVLAQTSQEFSVYVCDVGQGDGIFIDGGEGNQVLVDGGPDDSILTCLGNIMPIYDRSIDVVILTHPHADHVGGLVSVLERYNVGRVIESGVAYETAAYREWHEAIEGKRIPITIAQSGQEIFLGDGSVITILSPVRLHKDVLLKNPHDAMIVMRLDHGGSSVLLTGDMEDELERKLVYLGYPLDADILKVGHHGSKTSSSEEFLNAVTPGVAIVSAGENNRYGHPHAEILGRFQSLGVPMRRTDIDGVVVLKSMGDMLVVQ